MIDNYILCQGLLEDRDRLINVIREKDVKIAELERAITLRDQLITLEEEEGV